MSYAAQSDITTLYSEDALYVADRDGDGVPDGAAITRALNLATSEIDSYLAARYSLPLADTPDLLMQFCVDIALYRLALGRDVLTEEHRTRYEDTIKHLEKIASGKAVIPQLLDGGDEDTPANNRPRPIVTGGPEREFTRDKMKGL